MRVSAGLDGYSVWLLLGERRGTDKIMQQYDPEGGPYEFAPEVAARTTVLCLRVETLTGKSNAPKPEQA